LVLSAALTVCCGADDAEVRRRAERIGRPIERIDVAGSPAEVIEQLAAWREAGASRVYAQLLDIADLDLVRLLGREVLPALA
jgi:alkanesulfonate monooxygenase SsuD/methylene tetrahydromethanopterin reductase-like flavin-dependent oxidoreductase (luciferase family)